MTASAPYGSMSHMTFQTRTPSSLAMSILTALVENPPVYEEDRGYRAFVCACCGSYDATVQGTPDHTPDCAFRLAVNFVGTSTSTGSRFLVHCRSCERGVAYGRNRDSASALGVDHFALVHPGDDLHYNVLEIL